jgi:hypothetical protein
MSKMFQFSGMTQENVPTWLTYSLSIPDKNPANPYKEYNNVTKLDIEPSTNNYDLTIAKLKEQKGFDVISLETIKVHQHLTESPENIVFYYPTTENVYITKKKILRRFCRDVNFVKYACKEVYDILYVTPDKYDGDVPYLMGKSFGFWGILSIAQVKTIVESEEGHQFIVLEESGTVPSTVSLQMLGPNANAVGASHCQEGQQEKIYSMSSIDWTKLTGGRRRRHTKRAVKTTRRSRKYRRSSRKTRR